MAVMACLSLLGHLLAAYNLWEMTVTRHDTTMMKIVNCGGRHFMRAFAVHRCVHC